MFFESTIITLKTGYFFRLLLQKERNMKNPKSILILLFISTLFSHSSFSQIDISIGEWKSYLPYNEGVHITQSSEDIIYATDWAVMYINKEDNSIKKLDKIKGLSGVGIERIKHTGVEDVLIVAYANSVIDLVKPTEIITLFDIKVNSNISGDRKIYDIFVDSDSTAFLATGYGISKINFRQNIFVFSAIPELAFTGVLVKDNIIYATSDEGVYTAPNNTNLNLQDFGNWQLLDQTDGFPMDYSADKIVEFGGKIYLDIDDVLYSYENNILDSIYGEDGYSFKYLTAEGAHLILGLDCESGCNGKAVLFDSNETISEINNCINRSQYGIEDETGVVWLADRWRRFRSYDTNGGGCNDGFVLNSPYSVKSSDIEVHNGELWVTAGGITITNYFQFWFEGFYRTVDNEWEHYNRNNRPDLQGTLDFLRFAFHPEKEIAYIGSYWNGLVKFENNEFTIFERGNDTALGNAPTGDDHVTKVAGVAFDDDKNLWMANTDALSPVVMLSDEGEWKNFSIAPFNNTRLIEVIVDDFGYKWFTIGDNTAGILVFDEGDLDIDNDEETWVFKTGNSVLPSNTVSCLVKDLDGDIWAGTSDGIVFFECGSNIFSGDCQGTRRIVEQEGINEYLLRGEDVKTIAVDGANRKWVGTTNGVFVISPNGESQIAKFDVDNSPLYDNLISDIAIDQETGEVFIGTGEGIISYRADATLGDEFSHQSDVVVFPNPVRPEYEGPIAIKGLARDSNVKITDVAGQLVYEGKALGGQFIWDGKDYTGRKASSGVYLVLGTSTKNRELPQTVVGKILFMN